MESNNYFLVVLITCHFICNVHSNCRPIQVLNYGNFFVPNPLLVTHSEGFLGVPGIWRNILQKGDIFPRYSYFSKKKIKNGEIVLGYILTWLHNYLRIFRLSITRLANKSYFPTCLHDSKVRYINKIK